MHTNTTNTLIVIPARFNSGRFPGKPLITVCGRTLLHRVWLLARAVSKIDAVYIATDDHRIQHHAASFGAQVVMTGECANGSERVLQALDQLKLQPELVLNLQGDAVLTPCWVIQSLVDAMQRAPDITVGTVATPIPLSRYEAMWQAKCKGEIGSTTVVCDQHHNALYFSKAMLPFIRKIREPLKNPSLRCLSETPSTANDQPIALPPLYLHIGLYAYRYDALAHYVRLKPTPLEQMEGLEQLRLLEHGIPVRVVPVNIQGRTLASIDSPEDVTRVEEIIQREGELLADLEI